MREFRPARSSVRLWAFRLSSAIVLFVVIPVVAEWFIELAREFGLYEHPSQLVEGARAWLIALISSYEFAIFASFIIGVSIGLWLDRLLSQPRIERVIPPIRRRPIQLEFGHEAPFIIDVPFLNETAMNFNSGHLKTIRVKAVNTTEVTLTGCKAYLTSISIKNDLDEWDEVFSDRIELEWGFANATSNNTVNIPPHSHHFALVVTAKSGTNEFMAKTIPQSLRIFQLIKQPNNYKFGISVHADNEIHSDTIYIEVDWQGDSNTITAYSTAEEAA